MELFFISKAALIFFLCLLTLGIIVWILWASGRIAGNEPGAFLAGWHLGFIMIAWVGASIVGIVGSLVLMLYAYF